MLAATIPSALAAQADTPTGLRWVTEKETIEHVSTDGHTSTETLYPGAVVWNRVENCSNEYDVRLYLEGEEIDRSTWIFQADDVSPQLSAHLFWEAPRQSGTYTFTVRALGNDQDLTDSELATSPEFDYTRPAQQLGTSTNLRWDGATAHWDAVEGADSYAIYWYYSETGDEQEASAGVSWGLRGTSIPLEDWVVTDHGEGYYSFAIRAMANDVTQVCPGELSARSALYNTGDASVGVGGSLDEILSGLGEAPTAEDVKTAVEAVKDLDTDDLRVAMEADRSDNGVNSKISALEEKTGVDVSTQVSGGVDLDTDKISLTGAALNAGERVTNVTFNISKPDQNAVVPGTYDNAVQFDFALDGAAAAPGEEFAVPIRIKMPIPAGISPEKLRILHYTQSGDLEEVLFPYVAQEGGTWYATFVVKHFSTFVFAQEADIPSGEIAATIGDAKFRSLQDAIDAAESGDTISLYRTHPDTEVVRVAGKSLDISAGVYHIDPDTVVVGTNCTKTVTGTDGVDQVIHVKYRTSSGGSSGGGGGSSSSSKPTAAVNGSGGKVSVANDGTVTITPDEGYQIAKITVNGREVSIPSDGKLTGLNKVDHVVVTFERIPQPSTPFADVAEGTWYTDAVRYVYEKGIMSGTGSTSFSPKGTTTRGMIVTMLHSLENNPDSAAAGFADVAADAWYADAVAWAAANGVVSGVSATSFAPETPITREQLAAILYRYAQLKGYDVTASKDLSAYTDAAQISSYAVEAMQWANAAGLITGNSDTTLNPTGSASRAEVAVILTYFCETVAK